MTTKGRVLDDDESIRVLLERTKSIAVLGIKPGDKPDRAAYYVPELAQRAGYRVIPVPVHYPDVTSILGERVFRSVEAIGERVDMVNVFRKPADIPAHVDDLLAARPRSVWLQLGIRHDRAAEALTAAGIDVVQDRCLLVEIQRLS